MPYIDIYIGTFVFEKSQGSLKIRTIPQDHGFSNFRRLDLK